MDVLQLLRNFRIIQKWSRHACLFNIHSAMEEMSMGFFTGEKEILNSAKNAKLLYSCSVHLKLSWSFVIVTAILQFSWQSEMENFMIKCVQVKLFPQLSHANLHLNLVGNILNFTGPWSPNMRYQTADCCGKVARKGIWT